MYVNGHGVPQDYAEAVKWYRKAAEQGDGRALYVFEVLYASGSGVPQENYAEAATWYRKAAEQGAAAAQSILGVMYDLGHGVPQHYVEAAKWYRKAAEQGDAVAQNNLGAMYARGQLELPDFAEAATLFRKAAEQGDARAQYNLGSMYEYGHGMPHDYVQAHKWLNLAAAHFPASETQGRTVRTVAQRCACAWRLVNEADTSKEWFRCDMRLRGLSLGAACASSPPSTVPSPCRSSSLTSSARALALAGPPC
jgi:TPR repeat protein